MLNFPRIILLLSLVISAFYLVQGQEMGYFEGRLNYQIKIEGEDAPFILDNKPNQEMEIMVGEGNYIVQLTGGEYPKTLIFIADSNYEYTLDMEGRRAFRLSPHFDLNRETHEEEPEAVATGRTGKIGEYFCSEYKITKEDLILYYYVTDDYRIDRNAFPEIPRSKAMFLVKGLEGRIPIRTIKRTPTLTVTTSLSKLTSEDYVKDNFTIPTGFRVKWRDYRY